MEFLSLDALDRLGAVAALGLIAFLVITNKLVWHTRLTEVQERADRWEAVALEALTVGARAGVRAAEVTMGIVSALPDPQRDRDEEGINT